MQSAPPTQRSRVINPGGVLDDRGEPVRHAKLRVGACPSVASPIVSAALARHRALVASTWSIRYLQAVAALGSIAVSVAIAIPLGAVFVPYVPWDYEPFAYIGAFAVAASIPIALALIALVSVQALNRVTYRNLLLGIGRCPACGFAIGGNVEMAADGCMTCTECGAAWRADRVAPITVDEADAWQASRFRAAVRGAVQHPCVWRDARRNRVAPRVAARLPRNGPWSFPTRVIYSVGMVAGSVIGAMTVFVLAIASLGFFMHWLGESATRGASDGTKATVIVVALVMLLPAIMVLPAVFVAYTTASIRKLIVLAANHCPACENPLGEDARDDRTPVCRDCGAAWRRRARW